MWRWGGKDVTKHSVVQQPAPPGPLGQGDVNTSSARSDQWSGDGTSCAVVRLEVGAMGEKIGDTYGTERRYGKDRCVVGVKQGQKKIRKRRRI